MFHDNILLIALDRFVWSTRDCWFKSKETKEWARLLWIRFFINVFTQLYQTNPSKQTFTGLRPRWKKKHCHFLLTHDNLLGTANAQVPPFHFSLCLFFLSMNMGSEITLGLGSEPRTDTVYKGIASVQWTWIKMKEKEDWFPSGALLVSDSHLFKVLPADCANRITASPSVLTFKQQSFSLLLYCPLQHLG